MDGRVVAGISTDRAQSVRFLDRFFGASDPIRLEPLGVRTGRKLALSYLREPFLGADGSRARGHTNWQECRAMADVWREAGWSVDVVDRRDRRFFPRDAHAVVDLGVNLGRWAPDLPADCCKILPATGAHWLTQNEAEKNRLAELAKRRGLSLVPRRQNLPSRGIESCDLATVLGNNFTIESFRFAGKPLERIPISSAYEFPWAADRDFESARRRFLWMGSYGMVHKGLDLVLEAFAGMPDLQLTVCGRPEKEEDFWRAYRRELTSLPNIKFAGWLDLASPEFETIRCTHAAMVYPSCSEGGGGAVIHSMHAGLIPVVTREASVDTLDFGENIPASSVEEVSAALRRVSECVPAELEQRARAAWKHARTLHTLPAFTARYRDFVDDLLAGKLNSA